MRANASNVQVEIRCGRKINDPQEASMGRPQISKYPIKKGWVLDLETHGEQGLEWEPNSHTQKKDQSWKSMP